MNKIVKIMFIAAALLSAQDLLFSQTVTWQKWYDYNNLEDNGQDVIQTFDGGYIILSNNYVPLNNSSVLTKIDQFGNIQWQKLYDRNNLNGSTATCYAVTNSDDSGFVISGRSGTAILFKTDKMGEIKWIKRFSKPGYQGAFFTDHKISIYGDIIASGRVFDPARGFVVKTDSYGNLLWDSLYNYTSIIDRISESKDGNIYMLGFDSGFVITKKTITKTNMYGAVIWITNLFIPNAIDILNDSSGNILVGGGLDSMYLYKLDTSGAIMFQKNYYRGILGCDAMCLSKDGSILLTGPHWVNVIATVMAVTKVDPDGNLIFNKLIHSLTVKGNRSFLPMAVNSTNDYGFIFTGFTDYPQTFHESNIYATKTDSVCNAPLIVGISNFEEILPDNFILNQNYPNPFNPTTTISYSIPISGMVKLKIYDITGREILQLVNEIKETGRYEIRFDGSNLSSGVYFYKLESNGKFIDTKRMVLIK